MFLIGNKIDLENQSQVSKEEAQDLADQLEMQHYYTSAKDGTNVTHIFVKLAYEMVKRHLSDEDGNWPLAIHENEHIAHAKCQLFLRYGNLEIILFLKYTDLKEGNEGNPSSFYCLPIEVRDLIARMYLKSFNKLSWHNWLQKECSLPTQTKRGIFQVNQVVKSGGS